MSVSVVIKGSEKVVGQYTWWYRAVNGLILRSLVSGKVNAAYLGVQWLLFSPGSSVALAVYSVYYVHRSKR